MTTYSFLDINCAMNGPGGSVNLAAGAGAATEGVTIAPVADKNIMQIGAGGQGQHSLQGTSAALVTVRLLKTSPVNAQLMNMYNFQTSATVRHGRNTMVLSDLNRGDFITLQQVAFKRTPDNNYQAEAGINEWTFDAISSSQILGVGTPEL